jgi:hypothetical protein
MERPSPRSPVPSDLPALATVARTTPGCCRRARTTIACTNTSSHPRYALITAANGTDILIGGAGNDWIIAGNPADAVAFSLARHGVRSLLVEADGGGQRRLGQRRVGPYLIALGDFNIDRQGDPKYEAFTGEGLTPAPEHAALPRTLPTLRGGKFYDQIAWFTQSGRRKLTLGYEGRGGNFEFDQYVMRRMERVPLSYRISDHYPLWVEFVVPPAA